MKIIFHTLLHILHFVVGTQKYNLKYAQTISFDKKMSWKKVDLLSNDKMGKMLSRIFHSGHVVLIENVQSVNRLFDWKMNLTGWMEISWIIMVWAEIYLNDFIVFGEIDSLKFSFL